MRTTAAGRKRIGWRIALVVLGVLVATTAALLAVRSATRLDALRTE
ncbi:MAG: hypothetical protein ACRDQ1_21210 [Sciscionella sp.]